MRSEDLAGASVAIWGAGREGRAAAQLCRRLEVRAVVVTTDGTVPDIDGVPVIAGTRVLPTLLAADAIIKSPGVPATAPEFAAIRDAGVPVTSLSDLWISDHHQRVIAVTGTKGKSTTSTLIHHILTALDVDASLVGNGGTPVTDEVPVGATVAVAELSSYQARDLTVSPRVVAVTSLFPDHLPWHGGFENYVADKLNLVAHGTEAVVVASGDTALRDRVARRMSRDVALSTPEDHGIRVDEHGLRWEDVGRLRSAEIPIKGRHNAANVAVALATLVAAGLIPADDDRAAALAAVTTFAPLAHRLEVIESGDGRTWVDDSLATAPEAVVAALEAFPDHRVALIVGGADRGLDFSPLGDYAATRDADAGVIAVPIGPAGARLRAEHGMKFAAVAPTTTFSEAVAWAFDASHPAAVVLLSPGAPSFDAFPSYVERSEAFRRAALTGRGEPVTEPVQE